MSSAPIDLVGLRVGRLVVVARHGKRGARRLWKCRCDCGETAYIVTSHLRSDATRSCGCITRERISSPSAVAALTAGATTHGMSNTPTHTTWADMIQRCTNPKREKFARYGGRGVTVCARWRESFAAFYADMGERPAGMTLDRYPDRNGNYEPGNCRWATPTEQSHNRDATVLTADLVGEIRRRNALGESQKEIAADFGVTSGHINNVVRGRAWRSA